MEAEWQCASYGKDTCAINHRNVSKGDVFYFGIVCTGAANGSNCKFQVLVEAAEEIQLEDGIEFPVHMTKEEARTFLFPVPADINPNTSISVKASSYRGTVHDFRLSVGDKKGIPAWKKGQVIRLRPEDYSPGETLQMLLDV